MKHFGILFYFLISFLVSKADFFVDTIRIPIITNGINKGFSTVIDTVKGVGSVTSIGLTMPTGFSVANSPVISNGTINITTGLNGVIKGNGSGFSTSNVNLTSEVTGTLPIANGGTNATTANNAVNNLLPTQSGNANKFLTTDGSNSSWGTPDNTGIVLQANTIKLTSDQTTTSSGLVDLSGASITTTTQSGSFIFISISYSMSNSTTNGSTNRVSLLIDGVLQTELSSAFYTVATVPDQVQGGAITTITSGLSAGSHTFKLQWSTTTGTLQCRPATSNYEHASLSIIEIKSNS